MPRYVAFLRGINLGNRRVKMDDLRDHFGELDVENVATFIASGNVVFDHPGTDTATLEARIEEHLADALGFETDTFVRTLERLVEVAGLEAVEEAEAEGFTPYVTFLKREPTRQVEEALAALETPDDRFVITGREVLWFRRGRLTDSEIKTRDLEKAFGGAGGTRRKLNTVRRIVGKFAE